MVLLLLGFTVSSAESILVSWLELGLGLLDIGMFVISEFAEGLEPMLLTIY